MTHPIDIAIQPDLDTPYAEWGFQLQISDGRIEEVRGIGGITQAEESVGLIQEDLRELNWLNFRWMHYAVARIRAEMPADGRITITGAGTKTVLGVNEITPRARQIPIGTRGALSVARYTPSGGGTFRVQPQHAVAGERETFEILFEVGNTGIRQHGGVRVFTPYSSWSPPVLADDDVRFDTRGGARPETRLLPYSHPVFGYVYQVRAVEDALREGDTIRIRYHGVDGGIRPQTYPKTRAAFPGFVDATASGMYLPLPAADTGSVEVVPGAAANLRLALPMVARTGEPVCARVVVLDRCWNPVADRSGSPAVRLELRKDGDVVDRRGAQATDGEATIGELELRSEGLHEVTVSADGLEPATLVVKSTADPAASPLYWGAIHGHTEMSDGEFPPAAYYDYGRRWGLLDVCAVTDHDWEIVDHERSRRIGGFRHVQELANASNEPGRFATFSAYEWMGPDGHANVYYDNDRTDNPIYIGNVSFRDRADTPTLANLLDRYRDRDDVLIIPHSSHGQLWRTRDDTLMPVVEIYSCWGCSEIDKVGPIGSGAREGLRRGHRFGFIGGADSHHGSPGHTGHPSKYHILPCREGFAAVYAEELTRAAVFDALRRRRCYATAAERILLEFTMNGRPMGSEIHAPAGAPLHIETLAGGTAPIRSIELVQDGDVVADASGSSRIEHASWELPAPPGTHWLYVRVTQQNDERAWSSPVWTTA